MGKITYADKTALNVNPDIAAENKVQDTDMNNIKQVVNGNVSSIGNESDTWNSSTVYKIKDIVVYENIFYKNITGNYTANDPSVDTTNWQPISLYSMYNSLTTNYLESSQTSVNVNNNTWTNVSSLELPAGLWIVIAQFNYNQNANGVRQGNVSTTSGSSAVNFSINAVNGVVTRNRIAVVFNIDQTTTIYGNVSQTSGGQLSCYCYLYAVRISNNI